MDSTPVSARAQREPGPAYFVHPSSIVDPGCSIGIATKIWHFCHIMEGAQIGERCILGQNVYVAGEAVIGNGVKIQNNVSIYDGVILEDDVFCGPSCVFTNIKMPRSFVNQRDKYIRTLVCQGATIGANATVICGITIGKYAFVGAGSVVTENVAPFALVYGNPAKFQGWVNTAAQRDVAEGSSR
jgi:UDP-2-acetamido-3-amino-2,3-dideoxy-glucuronate N-acetyltransferase